MANQLEQGEHMMTSSNGNIFCVTGPLCGTGEFPSQWPVTWSFDVFFDLRLNSRVSKQSPGWWFEMPSCSLWRHCYEYHAILKKADEIPWDFTPARDLRNHDPAEAHFTTMVWSLTHRGRDKIAAIFQTTFSNAFSLVKICEFWLNVHRNFFLKVQLTIFQHWCR